MKSAEIRQAFLSYFERQGHSIVPSSSLVPGNDPTLLFTNAGMVQFKDVFLGTEQRDYTRATSSQRCVRAGGKHNDLENVGYTARHHTFFEMLGNFSFGDYFKRDAIRFGWEFLTKELGIPAEKLWVTVHVSDDEAAAIWLDEMGIDPTRFSRLDEDNFWQMGDTGPCGPSSEIFYDHGADIFGDPPGGPNDDGDRYVEIWNLVFMQFNRDASGELAPLPNPSIDTGMGLERVAAVMQGVHSNYEIDTFSNLIAAVAKLLDCDDLSHTSLRVIADHIRSCAFLIADGVLPSNEGRGYVLRRIIRRALRHGNKLGAEQAFFFKLVTALVAEMGDAYPELAKKQKQIEDALAREEDQFARTLDQGMRILEQDIAALSDGRIAGDTIFKLYDTYGFPVDLTGDIARERGLTLDMEGFDSAMAGQRERARAASNFKGGDAQLAGAKASEFTGYSALKSDTRISGLYRDGAVVDTLAEGERGTVVLEATPFYGESGGQVGDSGVLVAGESRFEVDDTQKQGDSVLHHGLVTAGALSVAEDVTAQVDAAVRSQTAANHSATHLLHAALRTVLGAHVEQKGSLVDSRRLRFDFSHPAAVSKAELRTIEQMVNAQIRANTAVETLVTDMETARERGAMMLFGEKYGDDVRVLSMGDGFSVELCGGTHVVRTGDIGLLHIVSESGIASGVRRIEAVTGASAETLLTDAEDRLGGVARLLKTAPEQLADKVQGLLTAQRALEKEVEQLKAKLATQGSGGDPMSQLEKVGDIALLALQLDGLDTGGLRTAMDDFKSRIGSGVVLLASAADGKVSLVCSVSKDLTGQLKAGDIMKAAAAAVGGKGGGRPDMAQGGGTDPAAIPAALDAARGVLAGS